MKRILSILVILTLLVTCMVSCKKDKETLPEVIPDLLGGLNGTDAIKLLLASERLDSQLLKNEGDIFESGVEAMTTLSSRAKANLKEATPLSTVTEAKRGGKLEVDGTTFKWSNFVENCNSYDYFENITGNIVSSAEQGASLIDDTKKYVRVIGKWVAMGDSEYYLQVDENAETIYSRENGILRICKRYRNSTGENTYELYFADETRETRMLYIPGIRYEWSEKQSEGEGQYFVADKSKGFWETFIVGEFPDHYNVSCFVMKNDICYDAIYDPKTSSITLLKTMSSNRASDILFFSDDKDTADIKLHLGAFNGINNVEIKTTSNKISNSPEYSGDIVVVYNNSPEETYATTTGVQSAVINLKNSKQIKAGNKYANGTVTTQRTLVYYGSEVYTSELELSVYGATDAEKFANLKAFLSETGLECKYNIDTTLSGIRRAYAELDAFVDYYRWNGYKIKTSGGISSAIAKESTVFSSLSALYENVKDAEVIDFNNEEAMELNMSFSPVTVVSSGNATFENMTAAVSGLQLKITDTTLFVKDQAYIVNFALVKIGGESGEIIHLETKSSTEIVYSNTETFTVGTAKTTIEIPVLDEGRYTLVSYVATSDKIRASQFVPVVFTEIPSEPTDLGGVTVSAEKNENSELILSFAKNIDVYVQIPTESELDLASLRLLLEEEAYKYGVASENPLEKYDAENDSFISVAEDETSIEATAYRLAYSVENGDVTRSGYIYASYSEA